MEKEFSPEPPQPSRGRRVALFLLSLCGWFILAVPLIRLVEWVIGVQYVPDMLTTETVLGRVYVIFLIISLFYVCTFMAIAPVSGEVPEEEVDEVVGRAEKHIDPLGIRSERGRDD